jgi:hypothetical protein
MEMETPVRIRAHALTRLVAVTPEVSGAPFWVWAWAGGMLRDAAPTVLVTPGPGLRDSRAARVAVFPEVAVLDGPAIEVDEEFGRLAAWLEANRDAIADHWFQLDAIRPEEFLAQLRPVPESRPAHANP